MGIVDFEPNSAFSVGPPAFFGLELSYDYVHPHEYVCLFDLERNELTGLSV